MIDTLLWVAFLAVAACWVRWVGMPAVRRMAEQLAERVARRDAELEHRRATCPYRPAPGAKTIIRDGWCEWCHVTHDQAADRPRLNTALFAAMRCGNVMPNVYGGVCGACGVPHVEPAQVRRDAADFVRLASRDPAAAARAVGAVSMHLPPIGPVLDTGILRATPRQAGQAQVIRLGRPRAKR